MIIRVPHHFFVGENILVEWCGVICAKESFVPKQKGKIESRTRKRRTQVKHGRTQVKHGRTQEQQEQHVPHELTVDKVKQESFLHRDKAPIHHDIRLKNKNYIQTALRKAQAFLVVDLLAAPNYIPSWTLVLWISRLLPTVSGTLSF